MWAAIRGDTASVRENTYQSGQQVRDLTALCLAVMFNQPEAVAILKPLEWQITDRLDFRAFHYACRVDNEAIWRLFPEEISEEQIKLLREAYDAECCCDGASQFLQNAVQLGCLRCCVKFIQQCRLKDYGGGTALTRAIHMDNEQIVRLLAPLEADYSVDRQSQIMHLLQFAFKPERSKRYLSILLEQRHQSRHKTTQITLDAIYDNISGFIGYRQEPMRTLRDQEEPPCHYAAMFGSMRVVRYLRRMQVGSLDQSRRTALFSAVKGENIRSVKSLIPYDSGKKARYGLTALMLACQRNQKRLLRYLRVVEAGMFDEDGRNAATYLVGIRENDGNLILRTEKTAGFLAAGKSVVELQADGNGPKEEVLVAIMDNPLAVTEMKLAQKQSQMYRKSEPEQMKIFQQVALTTERESIVIPPERQWFSVQISFESAFNRQILHAAAEILDFVGKTYRFTPVAKMRNIKGRFAVFQEVIKLTKKAASAYLRQFQ